MTWWRNCTSSVDSTSPTSSSTPLLPSTSSPSSSSTSASSSPTTAAILDVSAAFYTGDHSGLSTARVRLDYTLTIFHAYWPCTQCCQVTSHMLPVRQRCSNLPY